MATRIGKLEEVWNGLNYGFRKLVSLTVFQSLLLLLLMFDVSKQGSIIGIINKSELNSHDIATLTRIN